MSTRQYVASLTFLVLCAGYAPLAAQNGSPARLPVDLPSGTTLPVHLTHELRAGAPRAPGAITARTTQRVPVGRNMFLRPGTLVEGQYVTSSGGPVSFLTLRFTSLRINNASVPIRTRALAVANFRAVSETAEPSSGGTDRANPNPANWTTTQIGGDVISRSGWLGDMIDRSSHTVGFADYNGTYAKPAAPGAVPHALGVFSASARGAYGFGDGATLTSQGGDITLSVPGSLALHGNDNLLLEVIAQPEADAAGDGSESASPAIPPTHPR